MIVIGREPRKIPVLTGIDGVEFSECASNKLEVKIDGLPVPFIGRQELLQNKAASGRAKDLIDLGELQKL